MRTRTAPGRMLACLAVLAATGASAIVHAQSARAVADAAVDATDVSSTIDAACVPRASTPPAPGANVTSELPPFEPAPAPASAAPAPDEGSSAPGEDDSVTRALGSDSSDAPDPIADEGERTGSAEGESIPPRADVADEIAALSDRACLRALQRAQVPFERVRHAVAGVALPIRVVGAIAGVRYRASDRREIHELMDCRLGVALVRFSRMLRHLGIVELIHYSTYRPPGSRAVAQNPVQSRHAGGMAIDAAWFIREDGARYNVERDFHGHRGRVVCGPEARVPHHDAARIVRTIACDAARRGLFTVILTPNFNYQHRNHFHMEVTRNANWRFVH